jgi:hypothetical protein
MKVYMKNCLAGIRTIVNDHAVALYLETAIARNFFSNEEKMPDEFAICSGYAVYVWDMFFGHDEQMCGGLGIDILERKGEIVIVDDLRRNFSFNDLAKNAVWIQAHRAPPCVAYENLLKKQERAPV